MNKTEYVNMMYSSIEEYCRGKDIPEHIRMLCLCQSCLETGYGSSKLMMNNNAPFGIKATGNKPYYESKTTECINGEYKTITARFCKYETLAAAIDDYFKLLKWSRYAPVWSTSDFESAAEKIRECGYATSPAYTCSLIIVHDHVNEILNIDYNAIVNTKNDPLNVRSLPSTDAKILTTLPKGTKIKIEKNWSYVPKYGGFVSNEYIKEVQ